MFRPLLFFILCLTIQFQTTHSFAKTIERDTTERVILPPSITIAFDYFPAKLMTEPVAPGADDLKMQIDKWLIGFSLPFQKNKFSTITHGLEYSRLNFNYINSSPDLGVLVETTHIIRYSLVWEKVLSEKWDLLTIVNPGFASEFESNISKDDITLTLAMVGIRKYTERLSIGYGVGFNPNFGTHYPVPVLALRWNNGRNIKIETIFPVNFSIAYRPNPVFDLGMDMTLEGDSYHGNPAKYGVENPQLRYSVTKGGPSITFNMLPWLHLKCAGGFTFLRRLEFYDGSTEAGTFDIKQSGFLSFNLVVGSN